MIKIEKGNFPQFFMEHSQTFIYGGKTYTFFPYWIETTGEEMVAHHLEKLPDNLVKGIEIMRDIKPEDMYPNVANISPNLFNNLFKKDEA